jgi:hypothetical protein
MKFEEIMPALRAGKKVRLKAWANLRDEYLSLADSCNAELMLFQVVMDEWEVVPEPTRVADYWVPDSCWGYVRMDPTAVEFARKHTIAIGEQPDTAVLIPGTEREVSG